MATITLRLVKGSRLTYTEIDANFFNINQELVNHINSAVDAHDSSAISYPGSTNLAPGSVKTALDELDSEKAGKATNNTYSGTNNFDGDVNLGYDLGFTVDIRGKLELSGELGGLNQVATSNEDGTSSWRDRFPRVKKLCEVRSYLGNFFMVLMEDGTLRTWGYNAYGQTGTYSTQQSLAGVYQPVFARNTVFPPSTAKIVDVVVFGFNSFLLYDNGWVYSCGANAVGQCGLGSVATPIQAFGRIDYFVNNNIFIDKLVGSSYDGNAGITSAGNTFALAKGTNGKVYTWGLTYRGNGTAVGPISTPVEIPLITNATDIFVSTDAAGPSYWIIQGGQVFSCGYNINGNLGINVAATGAVAGQTITAVYTGTEPAIKVIPVTGHNTARNVYYGTTYILTSGGSVYSCGYNGSGQLGNGTLANTQEFAKITALNGVNIVDIESSNVGPYISLIALDSAGRLYSCGYGTYGLLADGTTAASKVTPTLVSSTVTFSRLVAFGSIPVTSTAVMGAFDNNNNLWIWGYAENGSFGVVAGTLSTTILASPSYVVFPKFEDGEYLVDASGATQNSSTYAYALTNFGKLYAAGYNLNREVSPESPLSRSYAWKAINLY